MLNGHISKNIEAIQPALLGNVWPNIRSEVASMEAPDHFLPEDVYYQCKSGESTLFILKVNDQHIGWMILKMIGSDLHIWMLYAKCGYDVMDLFRDDLMQIAKKANAKMLTFGTKRKGWERVAPKHGFTVRQTVYELSVE